jgi:hypothetical protein
MFVAVLLSCACACPSKSTAPAPAPVTPPPDAREVTPPPEDAMSTSSSFQPGPALSPSAALLAWLQASAAGGDRKLLRLPVVINFANPGRFSFGVCWIGTEPAKPGGGPPDDAVLIKPDSSGMSVSLVDQVKQKCGDKVMSCALWLDGLWGPLVEGGPQAPPAAGPTRWPFAITAVGDVVDPAATTTGFLKP